MISFKWNIIWQIHHLSLSLSFLRLFYFSRRNYRETSALLVCCSGSRLYFQQCVTRHALTPAVYFCNVYSPCKNKKDPNAGAAGCRGGSRRDAGNYTDDRERVLLQRTWRVSLFYHEVRTLEVSRMRKERSALNLFVHTAVSVCERFPKNCGKEIDSPTLSRWFLTCITCIETIHYEMIKYVMNVKMLK